MKPRTPQGRPVKYSVLPRVSKKSVFLQKTEVYPALDSRFFRRILLPTAEQPLYIFTDDVRLEVDLITDLQLADGSLFGGVRNDVDIEPVRVAAVDRETDTVDSDRALGHDVPGESRRDFEKKPPRPTIPGFIGERAGSVHMSAHQVSTEPVAEAQRPLQVESVAGSLTPERGAIQGLHRHIGGKEISLKGSDGQACAIDRDALAKLEIGKWTE